MIPRSVKAPTISLLRPLTMRTIVNGSRKLYSYEVQS